jgi:hypothetical protein
MEQAGEYLRKSFRMPKHSLSAKQLVRHLQGNKTVALATTTAQGEPRVAPIGSIFWRGQFHIPSVATAARAKHIAARPAISLSLDDDDVAIIVHGHGDILKPDYPAFAELDGILKREIGESVKDWGDGVYIRVIAERMFTFAYHPEQLAQ